MKYTLTTTNNRSEATQKVMAAKRARLTHTIAIQLTSWHKAVPFLILAPRGQSGNF
jgi:hypothetical protein